MATGIPWRFLGINCKFPVPTAGSSSHGWYYSIGSTVLVEICRKSLKRADVRDHCVASIVSGYYAKNGFYSPASTVGGREQAWKIFNADATSSSRVSSPDSPPPLLLLPPLPPPSTRGSTKATPPPCHSRCGRDQTEIFNNTYLARASRLEGEEEEGQNQGGGADGRGNKIKEGKKKYILKKSKKGKPERPKLPVRTVGPPHSC